MAIQDKYQIQAALSDGEFQVSRAIQLSSGLPVLIHHLGTGEALLFQSELTLLIFRFLRVEPSRESLHFLDMGEDSGRIYVVTDNVPQCLNLRRWLMSVTEGPAANLGGSPPAAGSPSLPGVNSTRAFNIDSFREILGIRDGETAPPSAPPVAAPPPVPPSASLPGTWPPRPMAPAGSSEVTERKPTGFAANVRPPAPAPAPPVFSTTPARPPVTAKVPERISPPPPSILDLDTAMLTPPVPRAKPGSSQIADFILEPTRVAKPPVAPSQPKASKPPLPPPAPFPLPRPAEKVEAAGKSTVKLPRPETSGGFEAVFQSTKPSAVAAPPTVQATPPADYRTSLSAAVPAPSPSTTVSMTVTAPSPSVFVTYDTPLDPAHKPHKNWPPIVILSSLFLMTVGLLLFYAFKH